MGGSCSQPVRGTAWSFVWKSLGWDFFERTAAMLWALALASGMGLLLGLRLRVPSVLAASAILVVCCVAVMPFANWSFLPAAAFTFGLLGALQCAYLAGLMLSCAWTRARSSPATAGLPTLSGPHHSTEPR